MKLLLAMYIEPPAQLVAMEKHDLISPHFFIVEVHRKVCSASAALLAFLSELHFIYPMSL
jgi:hypothetical protein